MHRGFPCRADVCATLFSRNRVPTPAQLPPMFVIAPPFFLAHNTAHRRIRRLLRRHRHRDTVLNKSSYIESLKTATQQLSKCVPKSCYALGYDDIHLPPRSHCEHAAPLSAQQSSLIAISRDFLSSPPPRYKYSRLSFPFPFFTSFFFYPLLNYQYYHL